MENHINKVLRNAQMLKFPFVLPFSSLTSMSRGRRVILCMGRMRNEIMGRFLQSGWPSILVSTSLKARFLELKRGREKKLDQKSNDDTQR